MQSHTFMLLPKMWQCNRCISLIKWLYGKNEDGSFFLDFRTKNIFLPILTVVSIAKDTKNFIFQNTSMYTNLHYNVWVVYNCVY